MRPYRIQQSEFPYHVTTRTNGQKFRLTHATYRIIANILNDMVHRYGIVVHHLQLMNNHYHMVLTSPHANLSAAMCFFNGRLSRHINRLQRTKGHLWEKRFHATIIENDEYAATCVRYVYQNPLRAGACQSLEASPLLSSFSFYANGRRIPLRVNADGFYLGLGRTTAERQKNFTEWVTTPLLATARAACAKALRGVFFGSAAFLHTMQQRYAKALRRKTIVPRDTIVPGH